MGRDDALLGAFEEQVLLAVAHLGDRAYGMTVRRFIQARTGREISIGAVYATLERLEQKGWLSTHLESGAEERRGRARKLVRLAREGAEVLRWAQDLRSRMWEGMDPAVLPRGGS